MKFIDAAKRNHLVVGIILTSGAVAFLWIIWYIGATRYQSAVDDWIRIGKAEGYEISFDRREQFGFPHKTVLRFTNVHWKNTDGVEFHAGDLDISAAFFATQNFNAHFKGQVEISMPADDGHASLVLGGEGGDVQVTLSKQGLWEECALDMRAAHVGRSPDYVFSIGHARVTARRPADEPKNNKDAGLTLSTEAEDVTLPAAAPQTFGPKIAQMEIGARLMGPIPDFRDKDSVAAWDKINGLVNFDRVHLVWGPLLMQAKGTMNFDDDQQPEGVFAAVVGHQDKIIELLSNAGYIAPTQQEILSSAMHYLAKPAPIDGEQGVEVPIAVQLGGFFFGPIRIFAFAPIDWSH